MPHLKNKRRVDRQLLDSYHFMPCLCCGSRSGIVAHHIKTKGSGGPDHERNLMPLCFEHHREVHDKGLTEFSMRYPRVCFMLEDYGWVFSDIANRWMPPGFH